MLFFWRHTWSWIRDTRGEMTTVTPVPSSEGSWYIRLLPGTECTLLLSTGNHDVVHPTSRLQSNEDLHLFC